ncbi:MAG: glycosyltransferase family 4 protein [Planctomycetes bacterium]|nr:glycosyltransferase family 4 protein [Planctomycetota bacterium]
MSPSPVSPLSVAIDATAAASARPTGVGRAIAELVAGLRAAPPGGAELEVVYRLSRWRRRAHFLPPPARLFHERLSWRLASRVQVFHGPDARLPRFSGPRFVATVHDFSARNPDFATERFLALREGHWRAVAERATAIVTYTEAIKREVVHTLGVPAERVAVVPLAAAVAAPDPKALQAVRSKVGTDPFVLVLGEVSARKNTLGALLAFERAQLGPRTKLVVVGPDGRGADAFSLSPRRVALGERVLRLPYLPGAEVEALMSEARALLFPTRYEGFGLPVLEAFAHGVPVVASRDPSVREVAGGACWHADADDVEELAEALRQAVADGPARAARIAAGRLRAEGFTWSRSAARLWEVYRAVAEGRPAARAREEPTCSR